MKEDTRKLEAFNRNYFMVEASEFKVLSNAYWNEMTLLGVMVYESEI